MKRNIITVRPIPIFAYTDNFYKKKLFFIFFHDITYRYTDAVLLLLEFIRYLKMKKGRIPFVYEKRILSISYQ